MDENVDGRIGHKSFVFNDTRQDMGLTENSHQAHHKYIDVSVVFGRFDLNV